MNDWLIKIEQHDHEVREQYPEMESEEFESERMARVIRELARAVVVYRGALLSSNLGAHVEVREENILSPDAKELVK